MKFAFTLVHHLGDDGDAPEGRILRMSEARFSELGPEGKKLVREATKEEVESGYEPPFEKDETTAPETDGEPEGEQGGEKQKPEPANKKAQAPANKARA